MASYKMDNLRILATEVGDFKRDDVVPAYALAQANPDILVEKKLCSWTDDPATVTVSTETLATASPEASKDLVVAHTALMADHKEAIEQIDILHAKCLDLEKQTKALTAELSQKVNDIETYKSQRDKALLEIEQCKKLLAETASTTPPATPPAPTKPIAI